MDTSSIGALTGTSESTKKKKDGSPGDADAFASAMGDADVAEAEGDKKAQLINKEESAKEKADKAAADKKQDIKNDVAKNSAKQKETKAKHAKGNVSDYLQNIASKDPATLSMAERQAFQLGEFKGEGGKKAGGMAQMLASQGIDMSSFSPQQIMSLMSRMDTKELGKMMSQMKGSGANFDGETMAKLQEQLNSTNQNKATPKEPPSFNLESFAAAGMPKEAGETARAEQRRNIMDQLLTKIQVRNVANQTEMNLRLNPEYLGDVKIKLVHDDDGGVRATFETTSKLTSEVLTESKEELMEQARDNGVRIGTMDVEFVEQISG